MNDNRFIKNDLIVKIYTIGYEPYGESVLFIICDDNEILFTGVIDCYEKGEGKLLEIIDKLGIKTIDYFCITHPDRDHCIGINSLVSLFNKNSIIVLPKDLFNYINNYDEEVRDNLNSLNSKITSRVNAKDRPYYISCSESQEIIDNICFIDNTARKYDLNIRTLSPISTEIERSNIKKNYDVNNNLTNNLFSILTTIQIGGLKLLFTGDIMDSSLKFIINRKTKFNYFFFNDRIAYLKIPHHSSKHSKNIFQLLERVEKVETSVSTVYRSSNLPDKFIINSYKDISDEVYCTGDIDKKVLTSDYGIVLTEFNLTKEIHQVIKYGNSIMC